jgi:hypothetical protein
MTGRSITVTGGFGALGRVWNRSAWNRDHELNQKDRDFEIILRTRIRRVVFFAGFAGAVILALMMSLFMR